MSEKLSVLLDDIRSCRICEKYLVHEPRPIVQLDYSATILIVGQAPGRKVQETGIPFADPSGDRLRDWMGVSKDVFYDASKIALLPMGFCYPGTGKSGDLPPRKECATTWRQQALDALPNIELTLVIGNYAMDWHLGDSKRQNLTETVKAWESFVTSNLLPLPHPSPRNNIWLRKNPWFEEDVLPYLKKEVAVKLTA